jgi:phage FluMu protein Com
MALVRSSLATHSQDPAEKLETRAEYRMRQCFRCSTINQVYIEDVRVRIRISIKWQSYQLAKLVRISLRLIGEIREYEAHTTFYASLSHFCVNASCYWQGHS